MKMTGLQIFKYTPAAQKLPQSNCRQCGCQTCMAYSLKLAKQQVEIDKCPYLPEELKEKYSQNIKHAQKIVTIGDLKIGGENVLYRHEKTFINPTSLAVIVDCTMPDYENIISRILDFGINILNKKVGVDLIILKKEDDIKKSCVIPVDSLRLLTNQSDFLKNLSSYSFCDENYILPRLNLIKEQDFKSTKDILITTRTKAINEKDDSCSDPVCVIMKNDDIPSQCAKAAYYICKYANMIVFEQFDENMFSSLLTLRQNIFTDPQKTLQVEPGLYRFNNPDENSIIFLTTNFALTFFAVSNELESLDIPSYLIVIPAQGMSVLTAWSAETFNPDIVAKTISELDIKNQIKTRKIIIPGLIGDMINELKQACPDFEFIKGTHDAGDIANFVKNL